MWGHHNSVVSLLVKLPREYLRFFILFCHSSPVQYQLRNIDTVCVCWKSVVAIVPLACNCSTECHMCQTTTPSKPESCDVTAPAKFTNTPRRGGWLSWYKTNHCLKKTQNYQKEYQKGKGHGGLIPQGTQLNNLLKWPGHIIVRDITACHGRDSYIFSWILNMHIFYTKRVTSSMQAVVSFDKDDQVSSQRGSRPT